MYRPESFQSGGNSYLGLASTTAADNAIGAGLSKSFKNIPERPFLPLQFMAVSRVTGLLVQQISMNNKNFMSQSDGYGMPVELFTEVSQAMGLVWDTISTSNGVTLKIFNQNAVSADFLAGFAGIQLEQS